MFQVKILEDRINKLQVLLNEQAHEKAKRAERLEIVSRTANTNPTLFNDL